VAVYTPSRQSPQEALVSQQLPADVRHVLLVAALALSALFCAIPRIEKWCQRSYAVLAFRAYVHVMRRYLAYPFRLLRKRPTMTTAGAVESPTPARAVPHSHDDVEVTRDDQ
jgi:hypothetical protein